MKAARFSTQHFIGSFGQDPPRLGSLRLHDSIGEDVRKELSKRGHKVQLTSHNIGGIAMLYIDQSTGIVHGAGVAAKGIE
jgi:gamma-glutamyltranspeptidase